MANPGPPAWVWLLGALVAVGAGATMLLAGTVPALGGALVVAGVASAYVGIRTGNRSLRDAAGAPAPSHGAESVSTVPLVRDKDVEDYGNVAAVRAALKNPKRACKECGSPVLDEASECPTCGSAP